MCTGKADGKTSNLQTLQSRLVVEIVGCTFAKCLKILVNLTLLLHLSPGHITVPPQRAGTPIFQVFVDTGWAGDDDDATGLLLSRFETVWSQLGGLVKTSSIEVEETA